MCLHHLVPGAVQSVYAYSEDSNSIDVGWSRIPEEDTHGVLLGYVVYYKLFISSENFTTVHVNASTRVLGLTGLTEAATYEIKVAGRTSAGEGPFSTVYENTGLLVAAVLITVNCWFIFQKVGFQKIISLFSAGLYKVNNSIEQLSCRVNAKSIPTK